MEEILLLPCPDCGSDLIDVDSSRSLRITVIRCMDCDRRREYNIHEEAGMKRWNKEVKLETKNKQ